MFPLVIPNESAFANARVLHLQNGWSFWDAMIAAACLEAGVKLLYTEDLPGRSFPGQLEIVNPFL